MEIRNPKSVFCWDKYQKLPIIGIARGFKIKHLEFLLPIFKRVGFQNIEITMNSEGAESILQKIVLQEQSSINIGAGTVCSIKELEIALSAGASYIVTPNVNESVIKACKNFQVPIFCGAFTSTEIYKAWDLGADVIKVFPVGTLGPRYIKELKGPFPKIKLLPTGGVDLSNCREYIENGAFGLGMGSSLFPSQIMESFDEILLEQHLLSVKNQLFVKS